MRPEYTSLRPSGVVVGIDFTNSSLSSYTVRTSGSSSMSKVDPVEERIFTVMLVIIKFALIELMNKTYKASGSLSCRERSFYDKREHHRTARDGQKNFPCRPKQYILLRH
jgi:hypothetical protein